MIKLSSNPLTVATMSEHVDVDLTKMLRLEMTLDEGADAAMAMLARTINGRLTRAKRKLARHLKRDGFPENLP